MMVFKFKESDLEILKKYLKDKQLLNLFNSKEKIENIKKYEYKTTVYEVTMLFCEAEKLLDYLSDILAKEGFDKNDNLTLLGEEVEKLIDIFNYYDQI